ncbi:MAG: TonB-dependent receptor [Pseudomonadota bacterium]
MVEGSTSPATAAHVVTAEELDMAGVETLAEALDQVAGALTRMAGQGAARLDLRASRQRSACVLLDGVPVSEPWGGSFDLARVPVAAVESLRVVPGPPGETALPGCPGGVVEVRLRDPEVAHGGDLRLEGGSGWSAALRATSAGDLGGGAALAALQATHRAFTTLPRDFVPMNAEDGGHRDLSDEDGVALLGGFVRRGARSSLNLGYHGLLSRHGVPPDASMAPRFQRVAPLHREQLGLRWVATPRQDLSVAASLYGAGLRQDTARYTDADTATWTWSESVRAGELGGATSVHASPRPGLRLGAGAAARLAGAQVHEQDTQNAHSQQAGEGTWSAGAGVRLGPWRGSTTDLWVRACGPGGGSAVLACGRAEQRWRFGPGLALRASGGRDARAPTLRERYDTTRGRPDLLPEVLEQVELGFEGAPGQVVAWDLTGWQVWSHGEINAPGDSDPFTNNPDARYAGLESAVFLRPGSVLRLRLAHTWTRVLEGTLDHVPEHRLVGAARVQGPWRLTLDADAAWLGARTSGAVELAPYLVTGAQLGVELPRGWWARLRVANTLDTLYEERALDPQPGRSLSLQVGGHWWTATTP